MSQDIMSTNLGTVKKLRLKMQNIYNLFSRSSTINEIIQQYHFLVSWKSTSRNNSRAFLESQFLVVPIYCLQQTNLAEISFAFN